jgi:hypothetical protein
VTVDSKWGLMVHRVGTPSDLPTPPLYDGVLAVVMNPLGLWGYTSASGWTSLGTPGGAAAAASETSSGVVELATEAEVQAGTAGVLVATAARLKAEFDRRVPTSSETTAGLVELATAAETTTGTDTARAVHPAGLASRLTPPAWTAPTLLASWVNHGAPNQVAGYRKFLGTVECRGLIKDGTMTNGTVLFNLPAGYRPSSDRQFIGLQGANGACRLVVQTTGDVSIQGVTSNLFLSLESIRFDV